MSGYILGILISFLFARFNKKLFIHKIQFLFYKLFNKKEIYEIILVLYIIIISIIISLLCITINKFNSQSNITLIKQFNFYNFFTMLLLLNFSFAEKLILKSNDENCHKFISLISRSLVLGFIAPLLYIGIFNNFIALVICFLLSLDVKKTTYIKYLYNFLCILPSVITSIFLIFILVITKKINQLNFKNMFLKNFLIDPLINVEIIMITLQGTFLIIDYKEVASCKLIKYGTNKNIGKNDLYWLLTKSYIVCILSFIIFLIIK